MLFNFYKNFIKNIVLDRFDWEQEDIRIVFCYSSYTPDFINHSSTLDLYNVIDGFSIPLQNKTLEILDNQIQFKADSIVLNDISVNDLKYVILINQSKNELLCCFDLEIPRKISNGIMRLLWENDCVFKINF